MTILSIFMILTSVVVAWETAAWLLRHVTTRKVSLFPHAVGALFLIFCLVVVIPYTLSFYDRHHCDSSSETCEPLDSPANH